MVDGNEGKITGIQYFEGDCRLHEVKIDSEVKKYFYPCDYLDGKISFMTEKNQQNVNSSIKNTWNSENRIRETYTIRDAWRRGFIKPQ